MSSYAEQVTAAKRQILVNALVSARGNRTRAAAELGLSLRSMFRLIAETLTDHDINVISAKCLESGGFDEKHARGASRA